MNKNQVIKNVIDFLSIWRDKIPKGGHFNPIGRRFAHFWVILILWHK